MPIALGSTLRTCFRHEVSTELSKLPASISPITEADLAHLPDPVQRYFRAGGFVGRPHTLNARIGWERMRLRRVREGAWLELSAEQLNTVSEPARIVLMRGRLGGIVPFEGRDKYQAHSGNLRIHALKVVRVADSRGPELDTAELVTVLSEALLAPSYALQPYVHWFARDAHSAFAEMQDADTCVRGVFHFNAADECVRFETDDRFQDGRPPRRLPWSAELADYRSVDGVRFPSRLAATWHEPEGDFRYVEGVVRRIDFNVRSWEEPPFTA